MGRGRPRKRTPQHILANGPGGRPVQVELEQSPKGETGKERKARRAKNAERVQCAERGQLGMRAFFEPKEATSEVGEV